jgi:hypothetical protein
MSIDSWEKEFYPTPAWEVPEPEALAHSVRKWEGLLPINLNRHGVTFKRLQNLQFVGGDTCALCQHHLEDATACKTCPLGSRGDYCGYNGSTYLKCVVAQDGTEMHQRLLQIQKEVGNE